MKLAEKARFARVRATRGRSLACQASSIDLLHQSPTLDQALKATGARRFVTIRLLKKDDVAVFVETQLLWGKYSKRCLVRYSAFAYTSNLIVTLQKRSIRFDWRYPDDTTSCPSIQSSFQRHNY